MTIMKEYSKKQSKHLKICSLFLFLFLTCISVFSIQLNNCSINGQYYVDTYTYENITNTYNWESFVNPINRSKDYSNLVSPYFSNINNVLGNFNIRHRLERFSPVFCYNDVTFYDFTFSSSAVSKEYYYVVGNSGRQTRLIQINKTLLYSNSSFLLYNEFVQYECSITNLFRCVL